MHNVNAKKHNNLMVVNMQKILPEVNRKKHLEYIEYLKQQTGLSLSGLAKAAGLSDSTLTRFFVKNDYQRLSTATIDKLAKVAGFDSYEHYLLETHQADIPKEKIEIEDSTKFMVYDSTKRLLEKTKDITKPDVVSFVAQEVIANAQKLKTNFIPDSLVMFVIEKLDREGKL